MQSVSSSTGCSSSRGSSSSALPSPLSVSCFISNAFTKLKTCQTAYMIPPDWDWDWDRPIRTMCNRTAFGKPLDPTAGLLGEIRNNCEQTNHFYPSSYPYYHKRRELNRWSQSDQKSLFYRPKLNSLSFHHLSLVIALIVISAVIPCSLGSSTSNLVDHVHDQNERLVCMEGVSPPPPGGK